MKKEKVLLLSGIIIFCSWLYLRYGKETLQGFGIAIVIYGALALLHGDIKLKKGRIYIP